jgi:hypothetical protein
VGASCEGGFLNARRPPPLEQVEFAPIAPPRSCPDNEYCCDQCFSKSEVVEMRALVLLRGGSDRACTVTFSGCHHATWSYGPL